MKINQNWTTEEDQYLANLIYEHQNKFTWSIIAQKLNQNFKNKTRFGKQCRERFINHLHKLKGKVILSDWTKQETHYLFQIYAQLGSRWTQISKRLTTKTENCVKNKFYGSLRKTVRALNALLKLYYRKNKKQIKFKSILRILEYAEGRFRLQPQLYQKSIKIRQKLLNMTKNEEVKMEQGEVKVFVEKVNQFSITIRSYKTLKKGQHSQKYPQKEEQIQGSYSQEEKQQDQKQGVSTQPKGSIEGIQRTSRKNRQNLNENEQILLREELKNKQIQPNEQNLQKVEQIEQHNFFNFQENKNWGNFSQQFFFSQVDANIKEQDDIIKFF